MNRRSFLASLAAIAVAPKALDAIAAMRPAPVATGSLVTLQRAYRKMQGRLLEGFQQTTPEWEWMQSSVGFADVLTSTSVHKLRRSKVKNWNVRLR